MIPVTYGMDTAGGLILLVSLYCGSMYGGSISAILLHTPGTPSAAATVLDGYEMTKKGQAHEAVIEAAVASVWGGIFSILIMFLLAPPIAKLSVKFGPMDTFLLSIFGLTIIASLASKNMIKALISGVLGLLLGTVGMDKLVGFERYTFGVLYFQTGFQLVPILIGLFSISQVFVMVSDLKQSIVDTSTIKNVKSARLHLKDLMRYPITYLRSGIIGVIVGIIPGAGGNIACFIGYNEARRASKTPDEFGKGCRDGIAGPEAANNATTGGAMIPMLTLGIPGSATTAILLGGLMIKGLVPGNDLFTTKGNITYGVFFGMVLANIFFLLIGLSCAKYFANIAKTPINILAPLIVIFCVLGSFAINNYIVDVYVMIIFGIIGYFMRRFEFDVTPMVLGIILGPIGEAGLMSGFQIYRGLLPAFLHIFKAPISLILLAIIIISLFTPLLRSKQEKKLLTNEVQ
jgi:putative tricarboxylic transport membrane protein